MKLFLLLLGLALPSFALPTDPPIKEELTTRLGKVYHGVVAGKATSYDLPITHDDGAARVPLADLPEAWQIRFHYDAGKAETAGAAAAKKVDAAFAAAREEERLAAQPDPFAAPATPAREIRKDYGDLFVDSGTVPGLRSLIVGGRTYNQVQIAGRMEDGTVVLRTKEGRLEVTTAQIPAEWVAALANHEASATPQDNRMVQHDLSTDQLIKAYAATKWPDNFDMQLYEVTRQKEGWTQMLGYRREPRIKAIVERAQAKWGNNFEMQAYEVTRQLKALVELGK